jgi:hypothetical protein
MASSINVLGQAGRTKNPPQQMLTGGLLTSKGRPGTGLNLNQMKEKTSTTSAGHVVDLTTTAGWKELLHEGILHNVAQRFKKAAMRHSNNR